MGTLPTARYFVPLQPDQLMLVIQPDQLVLVMLPDQLTSALSASPLLAPHPLQTTVSVYGVSHLNTRVHTTRYTLYICLLDACLLA